MIELYSIRDVARILAVQESRLRYWMQVGFVGPTVRKGGRFYYTFCDLVAVKAAKDLLAADVTLQGARKAVEGLRKKLPGGLSKPLVRGAGATCSKEEAAERAAFYGRELADVEGASRPLAELIENVTICAELRRFGASAFTRALLATEKKR